MSHSYAKPGNMMSNLYQKGKLRAISNVPSKYNDLTKNGVVLTNSKKWCNCINVPIIAGEIPYL